MADIIIVFTSDNRGEYQRHEYGREGMVIYLTFPAGPTKYYWIPYEAGNIVVKRHYECYRFQDSCDSYNNEPKTVLVL